jgi:Mn2+/Fe2+ NRAMP family transporter
VVQVNPESWFWVTTLWSFAPAVAGVGLVAGGLAGLCFGAPALGAAWGACVLTGFAGTVGAMVEVVPLFQRGFGPRPGDLLAYLASVTMPTGAVALGTALAVGTPLAAVGGVLGALVPMVAYPTLVWLVRRGYD